MKYLLILFFVLLSFVSFSQSRILVDGIFDEWDDYPVLYTDAAGDGEFAGVDFGELRVYNDEEYLFFVLETGNEINLQDQNNISIYLDTDNNPNTGFSVQGIGAELYYAFGFRDGLFYVDGNPLEVFQSDIGLASAPTVASNRFEIAIRRDVTVEGHEVFQGNNLKIVFKDDLNDGDLLPSENGGLDYSFTSDVQEDLPAYSISRLYESDLRIISYNVLFDGLFDQDRLPSFERILQATSPNILGFQEIYDYSSEQVADQMETILPSDAGQEWFHAKEGPDCHVISRYPILKSSKIPGYNQNSGNGAFLLRVPGMETDLLIIVAHPPCCLNDFGRQIEVDLIMEFLRVAKDGGGPIQLEFNTPIVILGDMNFVGDHQQVTTLLQGDIFDESSYGPDFNPDWDGSDLLDSHPYTTGLPFSYTWYSESSDFSPGRLDYLIYSGSNLTMRNSFSLFTPALSQDSLAAHKLQKNDAIVASDHLPIVIDFEHDYLSAQENLLSQSVKKLEVFPNPTCGLTEVIFKIDERAIVEIELVSQDGRRVAELLKKTMSLGVHKMQFNTASIPAGLYFVKMKTAKLLNIKKVIVVK